MEGLKRKNGSRMTGAWRYRIPLRNSLRNRLGERHIIPVAPSLFAVRFFALHLPIETGRSLSSAAAILFKSPVLICLAVAAVVCLTAQARAVPISHSLFDDAWYSIEAGRAGRDLHGLYSVGLPHSGRAYGSFNEGDNIEWIYDALESQYTFLDDTLYRIMGGSYLLGSVCYPEWHGFRYYYWVSDSGRETVLAANQSAAAYAASIEQTEPGDTISLALRQGTTIQRYSHVTFGDMRRPYAGERIDVDAKAIPEPSTIVLFGLAAIQILRLRRTGER